MVDDVEAMQYIESLKNQVNSEQARSNQMMAHQTASMFNTDENPNLIQWQLEVDSLLERIYHLLKGDIIQIDKKGRTSWESPKDVRKKLLNEYGTDMILSVLVSYINRNLLLSNYNEKTINKRVYDLGYEITDLIFANYEEMFYMPTAKELQILFYKKLNDTNEHAMFKLKLLRNMGFDEGVIMNSRNLMLDDIKDLLNNIDGEMEKLRLSILKDKIKRYPLIVQTIVDQVESSYNRAFMGGERESLRTARVVTQSESANLNPQFEKNSHKNPMNPFSWFKK